MAVLIVLFVSWLLLRALGVFGVTALDSWRESACYALAIMFVFTGVAHFTSMRHDLVRMIPRVFPRPMAILYITGLLEFLGALGLALPSYRSMAGLCLVALLAAMFAANVKAARDRLTLRGKRATPLLLRLPMQLLFIGLILWASRAGSALSAIGHGP